MQHFRLSMMVSALGLTAAFIWGGLGGLVIAAILGVMEVSLSFDNAVVNATVLQNMDERWQRRFLIWGVLVAVFGMRFLFPLLIVSIVSGHGIIEVGQLALDDPMRYAEYLQKSHVSISAFGGIFLLLVFLAFLFDEDKEQHWLSIESRLAAIGRLDSIGIVVALVVLLGLQYLLPIYARNEALIAGISGIVLYVLVDSVSSLLGGDEDGETSRTVRRSGLMGFLYLELLDASFSFDGVIGSFAVSKDIVIIMIGLGIGAMFVRSLTVYLVKKGTLQEYIYLEHGAHYAIGVLAILMLLSAGLHISEVMTGLIGVTFIVLSLISSIQYNHSVALISESD